MHPWLVPTRTVWFQESSLITTPVGVIVLQTKWLAWFLMKKHRLMISSLMNNHCYNALLVRIFQRNRADVCERVRKINFKVLVHVIVEMQAPSLQGSWGSWRPPRAAAPVCWQNSSLHFRVNFVLLRPSTNRMRPTHKSADLNDDFIPKIPS